MNTSCRQVSHSEEPFTAEAEFHFNELMTGNSPPDQDTLLGVFWDEWRTRSEAAEIRYGKKEDLDSIANL